MRNLLTCVLILVSIHVVSAQSSNGCEKGWERSSNSCFRLVGDEISGKTRLNYTAAFNACRNNMAAALATIPDQETQTFVTALLAKSPKSHVWIGLKDERENRVFRWVRGDEMKFENWGPKQPDFGELLFKERCGYLRASPDYPGRWHDGICNYPRAYLCEKPAFNPSMPVESVCSTTPSYEFMKYGEKACFKLDMTLRSYDDKAAFCADGGAITSIVNPFHEAFLKNMLLRAGANSSWIGLETQKTIDNLKWRDNQPLLYTGWAKNYPVTTSKCIILTPSGWQDEDCAAQHPVLCKITMGNVPSSPPLLNGSSCPNSLTEYGVNVCATLVSGTPASWDAALESCKDSTLASMHNLKELNNLSGYADGEERWIGLRINEYDQFEWADGSVLDYSAFDDDEPFDVSKKCVALFSGTSPVVKEWRMADCSETKGFICGSAKEPPTEGGCSPGWFQLDSKCFQSIGLLEQERKTFTEAEAYCRVEGGGRGKLFHVTSQAAQSLLSLLLQQFVGKTNLWIGLSDVSAEGVFEWTDGRLLAFTQWAPYQPDGFNKIPTEPIRNCVEVRADPKYPGQWDDIDCLEKRGFICETYLDINLSASDAIFKICDTPAGYSKYRDSCFKYMNEMATFEEAQAICGVDNAWVSTARDGFYNSLLTLFTNWPLPSKGATWIGMRRDADTGTYQWTNGNDDESPWEFTYANWGKVMPTGVECTALQEDSTWSNVPCNDKNYFICEYSSSTGSTNAVTKTPVHCPSGWTLIERRCFMFDTLNKEYPQIHFTYSDALYECQQRYNATLPGLHSKKANDEFRKEAQNSLGSRNIWLSLHRTVDGYYRYEDERVINYVNWGRKPSDEGSDCVAMNIENGQWTNQQCFAMAGLVCETAALPGLQNPCPADWEHRSGDCYFVSKAMDDANWLSWHQAEEWCNRQGARLTPMKDAEEKQYVLHELLKGQAQSYWIGLTDRNSPMTYYWSDDEPATVALLEWDPSDARSLDSMEHCVLVNEKGLLEDHNCGIRRPYVCKWDNNKQVSFTTDAPPVGNCIEGAYKLNDRCYDLSFLKIKANVTWREAHKDCNLKYGEVASIHHRGVQAFLTTFLQEVQGNIWIGMTRKGKFNQFYWSDGSSIDYKNWAFGEPSSPYKQQANDVNYCVEMLNNPDNAGEWNDVDCNKKNSFICVMRVDINQNEQPLPFKASPDNKDYYTYGDSSYHVITYTTTNNNAQADCVEDGGYLASISNAYEQAFIEMLMAYRKVESAWIGLKRTDMNPYKWLDGWPTVFSSWAPGYPSGLSNLNGCVVMSTDGWRNVDCYKAHSAVCKTTGAPKPPRPPSERGSCPAGWQEQNRKCYYFDNERTDVSFMEALTYCHRLGPNVVPASSLRSGDNTYLTNTATSLLQVTNVWLGLYYQDQEFKWVDGSPYFYTHWRNDYPKMPVDSNGCVRLTAGTGLWENVDCFLKAGYVCEGPFAGTTEEPAVTVGSGEASTGESLSNNAIIGISVGCGGVAVIIVLVLICYMRENARMKRKLYAKYKE